MLAPKAGARQAHGGTLTHRPQARVGRRPSETLRSSRPAGASARIAMTPRATRFLGSCLRAARRRRRALAGAAAGCDRPRSAGPGGGRGSKGRQTVLKQLGRKGAVDRSRLGVSIEQDGQHRARGLRQQVGERETGHPRREQRAPMITLSARISSTPAAHRATDRASRCQTVMLTGEVAIQRAVRRKTAQPIESITTRSFGEVSFVLMPAKNSAEANRTTPST
jgi:hypothetical protein